MVIGGKWKVAIGCLLVLCVAFALWAYMNRDEAVNTRILHRQGYEVSLIKANVATSFTVKPEWIPKSVGEVNELNLVLEKKFNTTIVLESIGRRETDVYIHLNAIPSKSRESGHLLTTTLINPDGSYSTAAGTSDGKWQLSDETGNEIALLNYGTGDGPDNLSYLFLRNEDYKLFEQDLNITFTGYNLYGYKHTGGVVAEGKLLLYMAVVIALIFAYRRREVQENMLGLKLVGYAVLGGATLTINAWRLPIGFVMYWLFFRKPESVRKPNFKLKQFAALMGLFLFISPVLWSALQGAVSFESKSATVRDIPIEGLGMNGIWKALAAETYVDEEAKVSEYEAIVANDGEVEEIRFELVQRTEKGFVHTDAVYDAEASRLELKRFATDEWVQYPRQFEARYFFRTVDEWELLRLKSGVEAERVKLELISQEPVNYGIKDAEAYTVDGNGIHPVLAKDLPVQGIWMSVWGEGDFNPTGDGWGGKADYLFDVYPRSED